MMRFTNTYTLMISLLALVLSGCLDFEISTTVHDDGSISRAVAVTGDSTEVLDAKYPLRINHGWTRSYDTAADGRFMMFAQQDFPDVTALNSALQDSAGVYLRITARLDKSFDWFFTRYFYSETWHHYDPFGNLPLSEYLSAGELQLARAHVLTDTPFENRGDSLALEGTEQRFNEWRLRNMFESYYKVFLNGARLLGHPDLLPADITSKKDALYHAGAEALEQNNLERSADAFAAVMQTESAHDAFSANAVELQEFSEKRDMVDLIWKHDYVNRVSLPGILQETNAPAIEGNTAVWNEFVNLCYIDDVTMTAESRAINWWMVLLLSAVLLLLLVSLIFSAVRRRRNTILQW